MWIRDPQEGFVWPWSVVGRASPPVPGHLLVALDPATSEAETVRFNLINPVTNNRIKMKTVDAGTGEEVSRGQLVKGFEVARASMSCSTRKARRGEARIDAHHRHREVRAARLDRSPYWDTPYHLLPMGKTGIEAYAVIRAAMAKQNKLAIGRLVMSTRERICAIEIEEGGLVLNTLRTAEEVRALYVIGSPALPKPDPQMLQIAEKIIEQQSGDFDPSEFRDRYEDALRALIDQKRKGQSVKPSAQPANNDTKVIDLMAALRRAWAPAPSGGRPRSATGCGWQEETGRPEGGTTGMQLPLPGRGPPPAIGPRPA